MIISGNRFGTMNGKYIITANESYGVDDIARIMIENEMNDMAIFNATLKSDMREIKARQEGTLLESEITALSENAVKDFFKALIEKLKKFWAKMKGVFQKAYSMITAYVVRNGKAFIAANKKALSELPDSTVLKGECWVPKDTVDESIDLEELDLDKIKQEAISHAESSSASEVTKFCLKKIMPEYDTDKSIYDYLKDTCWEKKTNPTLSQCGGKNAMITALENGMKPIKELKKKEREAEKSIKKALKELEDADRAAAKKSEDEEEKERLTKSANAYKVASTGLTNAMSSAMRAIIRMSKFELAQCRINLAKAIGVHAHVESTLLASMIREAAEDVENLDDSDAENLTPEEQDIAQAIVDAVEEKLDEICDDDDED